MAMANIRSATGAALLSLALAGAPACSGDPVGMPMPDVCISPGDAHLTVRLLCPARSGPSVSCGFWLDSSDPGVVRLHGPSFVDLARGTVSDERLHVSGVAAGSASLEMTSSTARTTRLVSVEVSPGC